ncbi:MAG: GC-type dockerin domain-anchored protein [Planctomycetota bacterium]
MSRNTRIAIVTALAGAAGSSLVLADFTSADLRAQGFRAADGVYKGGFLNDAQETAVELAIARLKATAGSTTDECVKCLERLFANNRICKEKGTSGSWATALPDRKAGCDEEAEGIHLSCDVLGQSTNILAGVLAHEWVHINQTEADYRRNYEIDAYRAELVAYDRLGLRGTWIWRDTQRQLRNQEASPNAPRREAPGGERAVANGDLLSIVADEQEMWHISPDGLSVTPYSLLAAEPVDLHVLETDNHNDLVLIAGNQQVGGTDSVIEVLGSSGGLYGTVCQIQIPNSTILSMAGFPLDPSGDAWYIYALDIQNAVIHEIGMFFDPVLGFWEMQQFGVFADAAQYPQLSDASSISINEHPTALGASLFVEPRDRRSQSTVVLSDERMIITDTLDFGVADELTAGGDLGPFAWRDHVAIVPGFGETLNDGDTQVEVFAATRAPIEVWLSDPDDAKIELLGFGTIPDGDNFGFIPLSRPLRVGEFILAEDVDNASVVPGHAFRVGTVSGCPADLAPPYGIISNTDVDAFVAAFFANDPAADLAPPFGVISSTDVDAFVDAFFEGCGVAAGR